MNHYICTVFDRLHHALRMVPFEAQNDRYAVDQAILLQLLTPNGAAFELSQGERLILVHVASRPAWRSTHVKPEASTATMPPDHHAALAASGSG